jgi:phosphoribosylanthranilate isomerase
MDARIVVAHGADALGLVFYDNSPRCVSIDEAHAIVEAVPAFVSVVALFVDAEPAYIDTVLQHVNIDIIQFHGDESPQECGRYGKRFIKAISMRDEVDLVAMSRQYAHASALLIDSYRPGVPGGTGEVFDWERIPSDLDKAVILAGGLDTSNIERAIRTVQPYAVDVSSGVERDKGIKDEGKIESFMRGVDSVKSK